MELFDAESKVKLLMGLTFEWDPRKNHVNETKHGVSFHEAATVFGDPFALTIVDEAHSHDEHRWVSLGASAEGRLLVVVFAEREDRIRIITARQATRKERGQYEKNEA